jgi:nicotinamidase-related amidase
VSALTQLALSPRRAALLVIDIQERLAPAMPDDVRARVERNAAVLIEAARRIEIPVIASEQYPKGLGRTVPSLAAALDAGGPVDRLEKVEFSVCDAAAFAPLASKLAAAGRDQWIVTGMECHVCVWQTVRGLRGRGGAVHVVADAVSSRTKANWRLGLELARAAGAVVTSTETVVFDLLGRAGTDDFKALSRLIK